MLRNYPLPTGSHCQTAAIYDRRLLVSSDGVFREGMVLVLYLSLTLSPTHTFTRALCCTHAHTYTQAFAHTHPYTPPRGQATILDVPALHCAAEGPVVLHLPSTGRSSPLPVSDGKRNPSRN